MLCITKRSVECPYELDMDYHCDEFISFLR